MAQANAKLPRHFYIVFVSSLVINVSQCSLAYGERVKAMESRFTADIMLALRLSDASLPINLSQVRVLKKEVYSIAPSSKISSPLSVQSVILCVQLGTSNLDPELTHSLSHTFLRIRPLPLSPLSPIPNSTRTHHGGYHQRGSFGPTDTMGYW